MYLILGATLSLLPRYAYLILVLTLSLLPRYAYLILGATLSVWLPASSTSAELPPGAADSVDLIQALKLAQSPAVETTTGACSNREGQHAPGNTSHLEDLVVKLVDDKQDCFALSNF